MSDRYQSEYYRSRDSSSHDWGKTIYAGNLQPDIGEDVIKDFFQSWGAVTSVKLITDKDTGRSKGYGFVSFEDERDAQEALREANGRELDGLPVIVNIARGGGGGADHHPHHRHDARFDRYNGNSAGPWRGRGGRGRGPGFRPGYHNRDIIPHDRQRGSGKSTKRYSPKPRGRSRSRSRSTSRSRSRSRSARSGGDKERKRRRKAGMKSKTKSKSRSSSKSRSLSLERSKSCSPAPSPKRTETEHKDKESSKYKAPSPPLPTAGTSIPLSVPAPGGEQAPGTGHQVQPAAGQAAATNGTNHEQRGGAGNGLAEGATPLSVPPVAVPTPGVPDSQPALREAELAARVAKLTCELERETQVREQVVEDASKLTHRNGQLHSTLMGHTAWMHELQKGIARVLTAKQEYQAAEEALAKVQAEATTYLQLCGGGYIQQQVVQQQQQAVQYEQVGSVGNGKEKRTSVYMNGEPQDANQQQQQQLQQNLDGVNGRGGPEQEHRLNHDAMMGEREAQQAQQQEEGNEDEGGWRPVPAPPVKFILG